MSTGLFQYNDIKATILDKTEATALNEARYLVRLEMALVYSQDRAGLPEFAAILAHIESADNFPFGIPDPLAPWSELATAWTAYQLSRYENPRLWEQLTGNIMIRASGAKINPTQYIEQAKAEMVEQFKRRNDPPEGSDHGG